MNKKVVGKFKDELNGSIMTEFISLRSNVYSYKIFGDDYEGKRATGIVKRTVKRKLNFEQYYKTLFENERTTHKFLTFKSQGHQMYTVRNEKIGLSQFDTKRYYINNVESRPYE